MPGFYEVQPNTTPVTQDVNQYAKAIGGQYDIGNVTFANSVTNPATAIGGYALGAGGNLGVGNYLYAVTFVTGIPKSDGSYFISGETAASPTLTVTTITGNTLVTLTGIPIPAALTVIAKRIYRTVVGGTQLKLVTTLAPNVTVYPDNLADVGLGANVPTTNTTGTRLTQYPLISEVYPANVYLDPFMSLVSQVNWSTINMATNLIYGATRVSTGAQFAEIQFDVTLGPGVYDFTLLSHTGNNVGNYHVSLTGITPTIIISGYASPNVNNVLLTWVSAFSVPTGGQRRLRIGMDSKQIQSTGYLGLVSAIQFRRTTIIA